MPPLGGGGDNWEADGRGGGTSSCGSMICIDNGTASLSTKSSSAGARLSFIVFMNDWYALGKHSPQLITNVNRK